MDPEEMFDDSAYQEYKRRRELDVQDIDAEMSVPQYINDIQNQTYEAPEIIYISSDEEDDNNDSDSTFYSAGSDFESIDEFEDNCDNHSIVPNINVTDNTSNIISNIDDDDDSDDDVVFLYEIKADEKLSLNKELPKKQQQPKQKHPKKQTQPKKQKQTKKEKKRSREIITPQVNKSAPRVNKSAPKVNKSAKRVKIGCSRIKCRIRYYSIEEKPEYVYCHDCHVLTSREKDESFKGLCTITFNDNYYCYGCARLRSYFISPDEYSDVIKWFVTGKIPYYDMPCDLTPEELVSKLRSRRLQMERRARRFKESDASSLVTTSELYQLCVENDFKCAITGHYLFFSPDSSRTPYWSLSLDHIDPLLFTREQSIGWSRDNIQLMSSVLNCMKGHKSDEELRNWYDRLIKTKVIEL